MPAQRGLPARCRAQRFTVPEPKLKPDKKAVIPLEKGEVRKAFHDTWMVMGIVGLRWRGIVKRAVKGRHHQ